MTPGEPLPVVQTEEESDAPEDFDGLVELDEGTKAR